MSNSAQDEAIERAVRHVSTGWLPPQKETLERVRSGLSSGVYERDRHRLQVDLRDDISLYLYCLKELCENATPTETSLLGGGRAGLEKTTTSRICPREIFEQADLSTLKDILERSDSQISIHSFSEINPLQASRFRESVLSASTAELLAEKNDVDPDLGYSCGLMRQLGLTLIAWNYPRVYARALENLTRNDSLDFVLQRALGFSPSLLAITFARKWNLSEDLLVALGDKQAKIAQQNRQPKNEEKIGQVGDFLSKICEVGEALARANHPEQYPSALHDWEKAQEAIASHLGPTGMQQILNKASEYCKEYLKSTPTLKDFQEGDALKERIIDSRYATTKLEKNTHLRACPPEIREAISRLYYQMKPNKILKGNVRTLMFEIVPLAGFPCGCVFMLEPASRSLSPAVKVGEIPPERLRALKLGSALSHFDLVSSAFTLKSPLREERINPDGSRVVMFACSLGQAAPVGVLFLESTPAKGEDQTADIMPIFRALRQTLSDCLNLA
jgi:hypothetical protein